MKNSRPKILFGIFIVALFLRLSAVFSQEEIDKLPKSDAIEYDEMAVNLAAGNGLSLFINGSIDGTREILEGLKNDSALKVILHPENLGVGYSVLEAIRLARCDYFYSPCVDLEYRMEDVYKMIEKLEKENLDAVFGSRLIDKKHESKMSLVRERPYWLGTIIATALINLFYRKNLSDVIATKLIKVGVLRQLGCRAENVSSEFELASRLCKKGYKLGEVPVSYKPRSHREGKTVKAIDMIPAIIEMFKVKFFE